MSNRHITVDELGKCLRRFKDVLNELEGRVTALETASGGGDAVTPFAVTFGSLDGTITDGIWDEANAILRF